MDTNIDQLRHFLDRISNISLIGRIFSWGQTRNQLREASADLQKLISYSEILRDQKAKDDAKILQIESEVERIRTDIIKKDNEIEMLNTKIEEKGRDLLKITGEFSAEEERTKNIQQNFHQLSNDHNLLKNTNEILSGQIESINKELSTKTANLENQEKNNQSTLLEFERAKEQLLQQSPVIEKQLQDIATLSENNKSLSENNLRLVKELSAEQSTLRQLNPAYEQLRKDHAALGENYKNQQQINIENLEQLSDVKARFDNLQQQFKQTSEQNASLTKEEEFRRNEHGNNMAALQKIQQSIQDERSKEVDERNALEIERLKLLKETWSRHEVNAKNIIKTIASKHTVDYLDSVPFKGTPDNVLMISDEYVIFDAKSPGGEDLRNFQNYLKDQAEKAKKYAKLENVKSDIFFVVPSNTLESLQYFVYNLADYNVYVVSVDSLEQIIITLKKIEEYNFVEQLSPEERENICRILGKFAHLSKRRIQIDSFFAKQYIELAYRSETNLPSEILDKVREFERTDKINPPLEKRAKMISTKDLETEVGSLGRDAEAKGILMDQELISNGMNELKLYNTKELE